MAWTEMFGLLGRGGWLMVPIAICSVVGLAVFLERMYRLRETTVIPAAFVQGVLKRLEAGRVDEALGMCEASDAPVAEVFEAGIDHAGCDREVIRSSMAEAGERAVYRLEHFVDVLGSIATVSPLLGLLGTVLGMIDVFRQVVETAGGSGGAQAEILASGIWQALITTAAGLAVAIPVYLAYRYVLSRVDALAVTMEEQSGRVLERLVPVDQRGGASATSDSADRDSEEADSKQSDSKSATGGGNASEEGNDEVDEAAEAAEEAS